MARQDNITISGWLRPTLRAVPAVAVATRRHICQTAAKYYLEPTGCLGISRIQGEAPHGRPLKVGSHDWRGLEFSRLRLQESSAPHVTVALFWKPNGANRPLSPDIGRNVQVPSKQGLLTWTELCKPDALSESCAAILIRSQFHGNGTSGPRPFSYRVIAHRL